MRKCFSQHLKSCESTSKKGYLFGDSVAMDTFHYYHRWCKLVIPKTVTETSRSLRDRAHNKVSLAWPLIGKMHLQTWNGNYQNCLMHMSISSVVFLLWGVASHTFGAQIVNFTFMASYLSQSALCLSCSVLRMYELLSICLLLRYRDAFVAGSVIKLNQT